MKRNVAEHSPEAKAAAAPTSGHGGDCCSLGDPGRIFRVALGWFEPSAAGHCTRAAADQIVLELDLQAEPGWKHPVAQVLCGAFLGPGVGAMAASVAIPSCGRTGNWLVFRYQDSRWRQVFESHNGAELVAVGTDIKETQNVLRPERPALLSTSPVGMWSRVWHSGRSRFTSTAWRYTKTAAERAAKPLKLFYFYSPSGYAPGSNISAAAATEVWRVA